MIAPGKRTIEHLVPISLGGNGSFYNKKDCCKTCNNDRGNLPLSLWIGRMEARLARSKTIALNRVLEARIENAKYWQHYIDTAGEKLYRSNEIFLLYIKRGFK
jgi:hypothetical protein